MHNYSCIGDRYRLVTTEQRDDVYADQFGVKQPAFVVLETMSITVVEERIVKGDYGGEGPFTGLRALDEQGRSWYNCWDYFSETSMTPRWLWHHETDDGGYLFSYSYDCGTQQWPVFENGKPAEWAKSCNKHGYMNRFSIERGCWNCEIASKLAHHRTSRTGT